MITFERLDIGISYLHIPYTVSLQAIRVNFVYEGHRVKVKVTGTGNVKNVYSRNGPVLEKIEPSGLRAAWVFGYGGSNGATAISRDQK